MSGIITEIRTTVISRYSLFEYSHYSICSPLMGKGPKTSIVTFTSTPFTFTLLIVAHAFELFYGVGIPPLPPVVGFARG